LAFGTSAAGNLSDTRKRYSAARGNFTSDDCRKALQKKCSCSFTIRAGVLCETNLATDLGGDDLLVIELSIAFAKEFRINITDPDIETLQTLGDAERLIRDRVAQ
jgi:acyl carrier protein